MRSHTDNVTTIGTIIAHDLHDFEFDESSPAKAHERSHENVGGPSWVESLRLLRRDCGDLYPRPHGEISASFSQSRTTMCTSASMCRSNLLRQFGMRRLGDVSRRISWFSPLSAMCWKVRMLKPLSV